MLCCGNHKVFGKDIEHRLADLEHTKGERSASEIYTGIGGLA